ncbi:glutathione S-transferase C-terminal-like protein [Calocera viscosa TUFC12733]|uniref:glutathione transferase n=1 Tax=Calocera viscosa (strain TUFC12733) TaxID=1330018 RepID=A0A167PC44_CALVF|nr:glutathione S-transferase C-terminal-like protein [Calocera viscosa TUFC12733]
MSHGKQITLYTHNGGPNGWRVAIALELLGITYESVYLDFGKGEHKAPEYTKLNPNGRIPAIVDHKTGDFTLWESDAILLYLVDKYDPEHKISASTEADKYKQNQWLFFQASGQGPYFGQAAWFTFYHPEKIPSAINRYKDEIKRVWGVLDGVLKEREWLVGDKMSIADFAFIPWNEGAKGLLGADEGFDFEKQYPALAKWHKAMVTNPTIKKVLDTKAALADH